MTLNEHSPSPIARTRVPMEMHTSGVRDRTVLRTERADGTIRLIPSIGSSSTTGPTDGVPAVEPPARASASVVLVVVEVLEVDVVDDVDVVEVVDVVVDACTWIGLVVLVVEVEVLDVVEVVEVDVVDVVGVVDSMVRTNVEGPAEFEAVTV
jgi:hypothetical protein